MMKISLHSSFGEMESREVKAPCDVREAIIELIASVDEFFGGDKIIITDDNDEDEAA